MLEMSSDDSSPPPAKRVRKSVVKMAISDMTRLRQPPKFAVMSSEEVSAMIARMDAWCNDQLWFYRPYNGKQEEEEKTTQEKRYADELDISEKEEGAASVDAVKTKPTNPCQTIYKFYLDESCCESKFVTEMVPFNYEKGPRTSTPIKIAHAR